MVIDKWGEKVDQLRVRLRITDQKLLCDLTNQILPNAHVTSNKLVHKKRPFSSTVFHNLSLGVFYFVASVSLKTIE